MDAARKDGLDGDEARKMTGEIELMGEDLTALRVKANNELKVLLHERATDIKLMLVGELVLVLSFIGFAFWVQTRVTRYIALKLTAANERVREALSTVNSTTKSASSRADELGAIADSRSATCSPGSRRASKPTARPPRAIAPARWPASASSRRWMHRRSMSSWPMTSLQRHLS